MTDYPTRFLTAAAFALATGAPLAPAADELAPFVGADALKQIAEAAPDKAPAKPDKARKVLVLTESAKDLERAQKQSGMKFVPHRSAPHCAKAVALLGAKTGAYEATIATDARMLTADKLREFDAIVLACVYLEGKLYRVPRGQGEASAFDAPRKALLDFVRSGKGLVGVHNATAEALHRGEYNRMIGGTHHGHAWHARQKVPVKLDDANHPVNAAFASQGFTVQDDVYVFRAPYSREQLHVLLSVDVGGAPESMTAERADGDYPLSWVKTYGQGRVFYTALGHNPATFAEGKFLAHLLAGIQFALGDLKADAKGGKPLPAKADFSTMEGWTPLFDGTNLDAWKLSDKQKPHWVVDAEAGIIRYDGGAPTLWTKEVYKDFMLRVDWRLPRKADSGVFLRGTGKGQINIWTWSMGSGELWSYRGGAKTDELRKSYTPSKNADKPVGEWNTFLITLKGERLSVQVNGEEVISQAQLKGIPAEGPIALQRHGDPIEFKSVYIKPLEAEEK